MSRILVLEDEAGFQKLLSEVLGGADHQVVAARTAAEAQAVLDETGRFDLLMVDIRLPGPSGLDFLKQFRAADPTTPVIVMTAYADVQVVVESMRLNAIDFLIKPFGIDTLLPQVEQHLAAAPSEPATPPGPP